jgi:hypothetical protein
VTDEEAQQLAATLNHYVDMSTMTRLGRTVVAQASELHRAANAIVGLLADKQELRESRDLWRDARSEDISIDLAAARAEVVSLRERLAELEA